MLASGLWFVLTSKLSSKLPSGLSPELTCSVIIWCCHLVLSFELSSGLSSGVVNLGDVTHSPFYLFVENIIHSFCYRFLYYCFILCNFCVSSVSEVRWLWYYGYSLWLSVYNALQESSYIILIREFILIFQLAKNFEITIIQFNCLQTSFLTFTYRNNLQTWH
jgi:hypothetical protein